MKNNSPKNHRNSTLFITKNQIDPFVSIRSSITENSQYWKWGDDNLFPYALAMLSRRSTTHRRIINDKADYISGKGISYDKTLPALAGTVECVNGNGESLRQLLNKLAFDKSLLGNAFMEIVTDEKHTFLSLFHQDATKCRLSKDKNHVIMHHNWAEYSPAKAKRLPIYPRFEKGKDRLLRSVVHYKDYEPMFENYGLPKYIAGMNVSAIAYKTDKWNISRLDNSFQLSGIMVLDADIGGDTAQRGGKIRRKTRTGDVPGQRCGRERKFEIHPDIVGQRRRLERPPLSGDDRYRGRALVVQVAKRARLFDGILFGKDT